MALYAETRPLLLSWLTTVAVVAILYACSRDFNAIRARLEQCHARCLLAVRQVMDRQVNSICVLLAPVDSVLSALDQAHGIQG